MAWIESHQSLATHRKTYALSRILGIKRAQVIGHMHLLWWWALDNAQDGDLNSIDPQDIAAAMDWSGDSKTLLAALVASGFIDSSGVIHDWDDYAGRLNDRKAAHAQRNRDYRERQKQRLLMSPSRDSHVTVRRPSRDALPNHTITLPNLKKESIKKEPLKQKYGSELPNVLLTTEEHEKLLKRFGEQTALALIDDLSLAKAGRGYKSKSDYYTILNWARRKTQGGGNGQHQGHSGQTPSPTRGLSIPTRYTRPEELGAGAKDESSS